MVAANLYIPKSGSPPYPGVLFQMGHSPNGKAAITYQRGCQGLAQLGYLVLAFDPMGQGERINYPGPTGATRLPSTDDEHTVPGRQMLLIGETATRMQLWDAIRSLDVLAAHPLVDKQRLASTGQSGGGTLTMLLAGADERLAAAAVSSGNTENVVCADFHPPGSTDDAEQDFIGSARLGFDRWDVLWPFAPKPLLILTSAKDFFGTYSPSYERNGLQEYRYLQAAYSALGAAGKVQRGESPLPHGFSWEQRVAVYQFFERWLKDSDGRIVSEPPVQPESDETLWAAPGGSVVRGLGSRTPFQLLSDKAATIQTPKSPPADLVKLLTMDARLPAEPLRTLGRVGSQGCTIRAVEVRAAPFVWVPAWVFDPRQQPAATLLLLEPAGRDRDWQEGGLCHRLAQQGIRVCAADVRGIGDLAPEFSPGFPGYTREHQNEENYAWGSLILGRSLLGQRVADILAVVDSLTNRGGTIAVAARGSMTVPALCSAALDARIGKLFLAGHLLSWRNITETENYTHPFANFIPDILRHTDLPQLASACAPRRIVLAGVVDAAARDLPLERVRRDYDSPNIQIEENATWNAETLSRFSQ